MAETANIGAKMEKPQTNSFRKRFTAMHIAQLHIFIDL